MPLSQIASRWELWHSFGATEYELKHQRGHIDSVIAAERKERWVFLFNKAHQGTSIALLGVALTFVSVWLFKLQQITVGDFVLVATTLPVLTGVIWNFGDTMAR